MFDSASRDLHIVSCLARGDDCAVCLCPLRPRHALAMPFCGHVLHAHCMLTERQCPLCRGAATVLWLRDRGGWRLRTPEMFVAALVAHLRHCEARADYFTRMAALCRERFPGRGAAAPPPSPRREVAPETRARRGADGCRCDELLGEMGTTAHINVLVLVVLVMASMDTVHAKTAAEARALRMMMAVCATSVLPLASGAFRTSRARQRLLAKFRAVACLATLVLFVVGSFCGHAVDTMHLAVYAFIAVCNIGSGLYAVEMGHCTLCANNPSIL